MLNSYEGASHVGIVCLCVCLCAYGLYQAWLAWFELDKSRVRISAVFFFAAAAVAFLGRLSW